MVGRSCKGSLLSNLDMSSPESLLHSPPLPARFPASKADNVLPTPVVQITFPESLPPYHPRRVKLPSSVPPVRNPNAGRFSFSCVCCATAYGGGGYGYSWADVTMVGGHGSQTG